MKPVTEQFISQSFGIAEKPIELFKDTKNKLNKAAGSYGATSEANLWLPAAAPVYHLSRDLRDYVLVPCPVIITSMPNTNGDSVDVEEFLKFDPKLGQQYFKTFRGKPCYEEHDNQVFERAKGVILDVYLRPINKFGNGKYWKLVELMAYDRTKDPKLVDEILTKKSNAYSIGFYFNSYICSICGMLCGGGGSSAPCVHTQPRKPTYELDGRLAYRRCLRPIGFETSVVKNPAFTVAIGPHLMDMASYG